MRWLLKEIKHLTFLFWRTEIFFSINRLCFYLFQIFILPSMNYYVPTHLHGQGLYLISLLTVLTPVADTLINIQKVLVEMKNISHKLKFHLTEGWGNTQWCEYNATTGVLHFTVTLSVSIGFCDPTQKTQTTRLLYQLLPFIAGFVIYSIPIYST